VTPSALLAVAGYAILLVLMLPRGHAMRPLHRLGLVVALALVGAALFCLYEPARHA
jgi:hypothetical protein